MTSQSQTPPQIPQPQLLPREISPPDVAQPTALEPSPSAATGCNSLGCSLLVSEVRQIRCLITQTRTNDAWTRLPDVNQHLQQAAKRLETLKNQLQSEIQRSQTPARTSSEAEAATSAGQDEELRRQLLELRQELNFAEAVHHQAAMLLQGWAQTLAEQLQLDLATSYGQEMSPHTRFEELLAGNPRRPLAVG